MHPAAGMPYAYRSLNSSTLNSDVGNASNRGARALAVSVVSRLAQGFSNVRRFTVKHPMPVAIAVCVATLAGFTLTFVAGLVLGSANRDSERPLFRVIDRYADKLRHRLSSHTIVTAAQEGEIKISTIFVPIVGKPVQLPPATRGGTGGGLTEAHGHIVAVTHDGGVFFVTREGSVITPRVELPDNHFEAYRQANGLPEFAGVRFDLYHFRTIDIAYLEHRGQKAFALSQTFYEPEQTCFRNRVSIAYFDGDLAEPASITIPQSAWKVLYQSEPCLPLRRKHDGIAGNLAGGRILVDSKNERLFYTNGEYGWGGDTIAAPSGVPLPQDPKSHYGKIMAIDLATGAFAIHAHGLRNMQGITFDPQGRLWTVEHGPRGGDELNLIEEGSNYGWPHVSFGTAYNGLPLSYARSVGRHGGFVKPKLSWLPSIAPSCLTTIRGFHDAWDGDLLVTTLKTHKLVRIRVDGNRVVFAEDIKIGQGRRIRYALQHSDGRLVIMTDDREVIFFSPVKGGIGAEFVQRFLASDLKADEAVKEAAASALKKCTECHSLEKGDSTNSPSLAEIFGRKVASTAFEGYTAALKNASADRWTRKRLDAFLSDPQAVYPGAAMPNPQLSDPSLRRAVIDVLEALTKTD